MVFWPRPSHCSNTFVGEFFPRLTPIDVEAGLETGISYNELVTICLRCLLFVWTSDLNKIKLQKVVSNALWSSLTAQIVKFESPNSLILNIF
jgi:hypothetical protein